MKKLFLFFFLLAILQVTAQQKDNHCASDDVHSKSLRENPEYKRNFEKSNADWQIYAPKHIDDWRPKDNKGGSSTQMPPTVVTLNVVFHDLSAGSSFLLPNGSPVSGYQYILDKLNLIYNGTNVGSRPVTNNTFINFCLTTTNQYGDTYLFPSTQHPNVANATSLDKNIPTQLNNLVYASFSPSFFPTSKYINVYIVDDILGSVAGFATLPSSHGTPHDGIYIERQYLMNNSSLNDNMNVLAHEMGHYLGLFHTFGLCDTVVSGPGYNCSCDNGNCLFNGDMVCDTPPNVLQQSGYSAPANFPNTCTTDAAPHPANTITGDLQDPKDNYMDYGIWSLQNRFSQGQIMRMQFMIDPLVGPRKSLLGPSACANCSAMTACFFTLTANPAFATTDLRHEIVQVGTNTPPYSFTVTSPCTTTLGSQASYMWILRNLDTNTTTNGIGLSYTTIPSLAPGNYSLTFTATLNANTQCKESVGYNFVITPQAICTVVTPNTNSAGDWTSNNWQRISFENGWYHNGTNYVAGSTHSDNTQPGFNATGFDVIPLTAGNSISTALDPVLGGVTLPASANITNVMRVGLRTGGGGTAFYAKRTITVNRNNCRFRVWMLGASQGTDTNVRYPFQGGSGSSSSNDAAFGILSRYRYNSPVNTISSTYNANLGQDEGASNFNSTFHNVIVSQRINSPATDFPAIANTGGFHRMVAWKEYILDYSEFVDLNPETEITLTFFSHSNVDANALQNAYAYYGIECLGGTPQNYDFDMPDKVVSCSSPGTQSCAEYVIPMTVYAGASGYGTHNSSNTLFDNIKVYKLDSSGNPSATPHPISFVNTTTMKVCLDQQDAPFQDFRIICKTLRTTITKDFRVYIGFYNNIPDCTTGDVIDEAIHPNLINGDILLCGTNNLPTLNLTPTCITVPFTYQWYRRSENNNNTFDVITGATNASLQLAFNPANWSFNLPTVANNYNPYTCNTYIRKVLYNEPYCSNPKSKVSEEFHIYNSESITLKFANAFDNDICFGDTYNLQVTSPSLSVNNLQTIFYCALPAHFATANASASNHLTFQLFDPATNQVFGNVINYDFPGTFVNNAVIPTLNLNFSFNNINPATGNTPLFVPTATTTSFPISIRITGDYLGCTLNAAGHTTHIQDINFSQSAVGGLIAYNCATNTGIQSQNDGVTYGGYGWEFSSDNSTWTTISGQTLNTLSAGAVSSLGTPIYIRRRSNGTGECLDPSYSNTIFIILNHPSTVIFDPTNYPTTLCLGATAPVLGGASSNGILGTWSIATVSNQTSGDYIFTPLEGYCLPAYTYHVTVSNSVAPTFNQIGPFCAGVGFTLPTTSTNTIPVTGTWSPPLNINQTTTYTFAPSGGSNSCSANVTMTVVVNPVGTVSFANSNYLFSAICVGAVGPTLPNVDDNGVAGVWNPTAIMSDMSHDYTFTPTNTCIPPATYTIGVIQQCSGITISWGSEVSCQTADPRIKYDNNIADGACLRVCENSIITYELHGNTSLINHTDWNITGGTIVSETNTTCEIQWSNATFCALQGIIYLNNGTQLIINKCIEKLEAPHAAFGVFPLPPGEFFNTCVDSPTYFENYSFADNGDDNLYYNWYFSDGTTSNEFEPVHTFTEPGIYQVTLVVTNGCSCVGQSTGIIYVDEGQIQISCPSVVCEGSVATYTIDSSYAECSNLVWEVLGGEIVSQIHHNTEIQVLWNNAGADGFGYVSVTAPSCNSCVSKVKIPIVKQNGTITGSAEMCEKEQGLYSLPQWPTTDFNWSLDDHGTGAILILNTQRNEIVVQSNAPGILDLYCTYRNTLLDCGGTAHFTITVNSSANVSGSPKVCQNTTNTYEIRDQAGNLISNAIWTVTGPNTFEQTGTANPFSVTFPTEGIYYITTEDTGHCNPSPLEVTVLAIPAMPTAVSGPLVVCPGIPVTYSCTPPAGSTAHWSINASNGTIVGSSIGSSVLVNFNPLANGPFVLNVWYEKEECISNTFSLTINRDIPNMAVIDQDILVCGSSYGDYAINNVQADTYTWTIQPPTAGSIQGGQNTPSVHILWNQQAQIAQVKLEVKKCGKSYFMTPINVQIITAPTITISGSSSICSLQNASFSFTQSPIGSFANVDWDFGDGTTFSSTSATSAVHQYQTPTDGSVNYTVSATVSGGNGCLMDAIDTFDVLVSPSPVVSISPVNNLNLCEVLNPSSYTYSVNMQGGFAATDQIKWFRNNVQIQSGLGAPAATLNVSSFGVGTYYATVTNSFLCTSSTLTFMVYNNCGGCTAPQQIDIEVANNGCNGIIANPTVLPAGYTSANWQVNLPGATIISNTVPYFEADNIEPGEYPIRLYAAYDYNGQSCSTYKERNFIIPYKADLKYQVSCGSGNTYQVTLLDFSTYYPMTPATQYWFSVDNGNNWYAGTLASGIYQFTANLSPGNYQLGIRIYRPGYTACEKFIPLSLPDLISANFTFPNNTCKNSPVQFTVSNPQPGDQYSWDFGDGSTNLQQNAVKTFPAGLHSVTLTVTNQYSCSVSTTHLVTVIDFNMGGTINVTPPSACQGGQVTLHYNPNVSTTTPVNYFWYQNTVGNTPYASTTLPNSNLSVTQNGQYLVYLQDANGCRLYNTPAATVAFTPLPETPVITGNAIACAGSPINLKVPVNINVVYDWYINGVLQPAWHNSNTFTDTQGSPGTFIYSVVASLMAGANTCTSAPGTMSVEFVPSPDIPILALNVLTCDPYQVEVSVTNPQTDVGYYWSNGETGTSTIMTHDGPLQVRAVINECEAKSQLDLPIDLERLSWIFPKGCFKACDKPTGYIIGPRGDFEQWSWLANDAQIESGSGSVPPLVDLDANINYGMYLNNGYCDLTTGTMSFESIRCVECHYGIEIREIKCVTANNQTMYQIAFAVNNPNSTTTWATFGAPDGEGYFTPSTLSFPPGISNQTLLFTGQAGFNGGYVSAIITSQLEGRECIQKFEITFPADCESIEECRFINKLKGVNCVKTRESSIYHISFEITNPYPLNATTVVSVPAALGTISPSSVISPSGVTIQHFYFYPSNTFSGTGLPLTVTNSIGTVSCIKNFEIKLPATCPEIKRCEFEYGRLGITCGLMPNGQYAYSITQTIGNPYATVATLELSAPSGQGYFVPNVLTLPPGGSVQTFVFYPLNGFTGGLVNVLGEGHYKDEICSTNFTFNFKRLCCPTCRIEDIDDPKTKDTNLLILAPNPVSDISTIYYNFAETAGTKTIVLTDLLGRTLQEWNPEDSKGTITVDVKRYAQGQYLIIMRQDDQLIESTRMIKH